LRRRNSLKNGAKSQKQTQSYAGKTDSYRVTSATLKNGIFACIIRAMQPGPKIPPIETDKAGGGPFCSLPLTCAHIKTEKPFVRIWDGMRDSRIRPGISRHCERAERAWQSRAERTALDRHVADAPRDDGFVCSVEEG
jgi:hypothetical protein